MDRRQTCRLLWAGVVAGLAACQTPPAAPPVAAGPPPPPKPPSPPRVGLALGGGAARGFAHVGVIQVLEEAGVRPDLVAGTSAGSLIGAIYASGRNGAELGTLAATMDESAITDWSFPGRGLLRGEALARFVREQTGGRTIEQMNQPVRIGSREYVDGGLVSPVPVRFARQMGAQLVVAVDIATPPESNGTGDPFKILLQTFAIMGRSISMFELRDADILIRPALRGMSSADFTARRRAVAAGREAALRVLPDLRARIV